MALFGFSRLLGAPSVNFVPLVEGQDSGRPLRIDINLLEKFGKLSHSDADAIKNKLMQLSATAGGISSYSDRNNAMSHMTAIGAIGVSYKIFQTTDDAKSPPGVYITDIDIKSFADGEPGLYKVVRGEQEWGITDERPARIETGYAAINGLCSGIKQAATKLMPVMLDSAYDSKTVYNSENSLKTEGYTLFYNPPSLYTKGASFRTPSQKAKGLGYTAEMLKSEILNADRSVKNMKWVVHGDGTTLLGQALKLLDGQDLSRHTMIFMAPRADISKLLPIMNRCKINLHGDVMKIQADDWSSKIKQMASGPEIQRQLSAYHQFQDNDGLEKGMAFASMARRDLVDFGKNMASAAAAGSGAVATYGAIAAGTFFVSPAALSIAGAAGAAVSAYAMVVKAQSLRNAAATNLKDANLNPHLNPTKSRDDMNAAAVVRGGGLGPSFIKVLKAKMARG